MTERKHTPAKNIQRYLNMRRLKPMPQLGDIIHAVNVGSEFEGELLLSDLEVFWLQNSSLLEAMEDAVDLLEQAGYSTNEHRAAIKEAKGE